MTVNWLDMLGWTQEQVDDLRFTGFSYLRQGHYDRARVFFEALVSIDPKSLYDLQTLGALYLQIGNYRGAVEALNKALAIDAGDESALLNKAKALFQIAERVEGMRIAHELVKSKDARIKSLSEALLLAYR